MNMRSWGRQRRCVAVAICLLLLAVALATALTSDSVLAAAGRDSAWVGDWSTIGSSSVEQGWFTSATGIAVDNSNNEATRGNIYVAEPFDHALRVRAPGATIWYYLYISNNSRPTDYPWDVAVDKDGDVYVVNGVGYGQTEMVWKYKPSTKEWTDLTHGYPFHDARGIAVDNSGNVYVANTTPLSGEHSANSAVVKLAPNSSSWEVIGDYENHGFILPTGIATDGYGNLYVTHRSGDLSYLKKRAAGSNSWPIIATSTNPGIEFRGVTADRFGNIYWAAGNALQMIEKDSNDKVTIKQTPGGYFNIPCGIATDIDGGVYLTDNDLKLIMAHDGWVKKLAWVTQPGGGMAGESLSPQPAVYLAGAGGQIITGISGIEVTATLNNANGAVLSSSTATLVNGVATFSNLSVDRPGTYTLSCTCSLQSETITVVGADGDVYMKPTAAISSAPSTQFTVTAPPPAEAPTASPAAGVTVANGWKITLTSETPGATIRYTTDGSNPGSGSQGVVSGTEVTVTGDLGGTFTIKAYASAEGWSDSPVSTFTYSIYSADSYTVTFMDGGAVHATLTAPAGTPVGSATWPIPSKPGYNFNGWYTDVAGGTEFTDGTIVEADTTVYARYVPITYNLSYQLNGGTVSPANPLNYSIESADITLNSPTRAHYNFTGWSGTGIEGDPMLIVIIPQGSLGNREYSANWAPVSYSIDYDLKGGAVDPANPESYTVETADFTLQNPSRPGYTFDGWSGTEIPEGEQPSSVTITKGSSGARAYTAHWAAINYSIGYDLDGGAVDPANPTDYTVESPAITLNNPTRKHYHFAGWSGTGIEGAPLLSVTIPQGSLGDRSYTAHWGPVSYGISYDLAGGTVDPANPLDYTVETPNFTLYNPFRPGYTFAGWTGTDIEGDPLLSVTIARGSSGARAYTAHWAAINYSIGYDLAGGAVDPANPITYTVESPAITLNNPTRAHYNFTGWTGTDLGDDPSPDVTIPQGSLDDRSYTAHWEPVSYGITYNLAGGAVDPANPTDYTVESAAITLNNPTRKHYHFAGWSGTGIEGAPLLSVTIPRGSLGDRSYTAHWEPDRYSIDYELDGGRLDRANPAGYTIETPGFTLQNPVRNHYAFTGWTGTGLIKETLTVTVAAGSTGERQYAANWRPVSYNITYDLAGGAAANPKDYNVESQAITLDLPVRKHYRFAGWSGTGIVGSPMLSVTIPQGSAGDRSYTAHWTPVSYSITYDLAGGRLDRANPAGYTVKTPDFTLQNPTRQGYIFLGWTGSGLQAAEKVVVIPEGSTGDRSYSASWEKVVILNLPEAYTMSRSGSITWEVKPEGGSWDWDREYFSADFSSPGTFTALKAGTSTITYTVGGVEHRILVTVEDISLPGKDQKKILLWALLAAAALSAAGIWAKFRTPKKSSSN